METANRTVEGCAVHHDWAGALALTEPVPPGGYRWWYVDGLSDDGRHGITLIAFIGSVFSPYYARARRRGPADACDHVAMNVALYGAGGHRWAMTERTRGALAVDDSTLTIGPSAVRCDGANLTITLEEVTAPLPTRIRGTITLRPGALTTRRYPLDAAARHYWQPVAPCARIEVALSRPDLRWSGQGYVDCNAGGEPLEAAFESWHWSRATLADRSTAVLYDVVRRDGSEHALSLRIDPEGRAETFPAPPRAALPPSGWRVARATRCEANDAVVARTLEDGPFYARSLVSSALCGERVVSVHESLSLRRFSAPWVQALLPFRMPRRR